MSNDKTSITWIEPSKQIVLGCSDKLWEYLNNLRKTGINNMNILELAKVYKEIKSLDINLDKKENENDKS